VYFSAFLANKDYYYSERECEFTFAKNTPTSFRVYMHKTVDLIHYVVLP